MAERLLLALAFLWLGAVLAISFLEAPLRFRAPGVTLRIGLGIGRLVFRALNVVEAVLAVAVAAMLLTGPTAVALWAAVVLLAVQLLVVRPGLTRRSDRVLAGEDVPRSRGHLAYVAVEVLKALSLLVGGILLIVG